MFRKDVIESMLHSPVRNYAIPGLTSWLVGSQPVKGMGSLRLFSCERDHHEQIVPHSHRFDFTCLVLKGSVINILWEESLEGDEFVPSRLAYNGAIGGYTEPQPQDPKRYRASHFEHHEGDWYSMLHDQIHSIQFSRGTEVLFFEGPWKTNHSTIIEPFVHGEKVGTFQVEPWMFKRGAV